MEKSNRQSISFAFMLLMVVSAFAFTPSASGEASVSIEVIGDLESRSFASVNGTAAFIVNLTNDGDDDFTGASLRVSFEDSSWLDENVTMIYVSDDEVNGTGLVDVSSLTAGSSVHIYVNVTVGYGVNTQEDTVSMDLIFNDGDDNEWQSQALVTVTDWVAYESHFPDLPVVQNYNGGDQYNYSITVDNIGVTLVDNESVARDTDDVIRISFSLAGWDIRSYDLNWSNASRELVLDGMSAGQSYVFNFAINLTGNALAGPQTLSFFAQSGGGGGGMMGGDPPYFQANGMLDFPVYVEEKYGVSVSGASSQVADVSEGSSLISWSLEVRNLGNTKDTFSLVWDQSGVPAGWDLTVLPTTTGLLNAGQKFTVDVGLTVPADAAATAFDSTSTAQFSVVATSSDSVTSSASQSFSATVDQNYGVSLGVNNETKEANPGESVDFIFSLSNLGNGEDTFKADVSGAPAAWNTVLSEENITVPAVSNSQFTLTVTIPSNRVSGDSEDFVVTVSSSDGVTTTNSTVKVSTLQVFDIEVAHYAGSDGSVKVTQATQLSLRLNITNNGNGWDNLSFALSKEAPSWASLGANNYLLQPGKTETLVITLSPTVEDVSGRDYIFDVVVTSSNGVEWKSPQMTVSMEQKETAGEEVEQEELEPEEDSPGFGLLFSIISLTLVVLSRRK
tara:strand:- start:453 stop:2477 length:2025 start_codon:yes stop_codon:yes gene_type:complete